MPRRYRIETRRPVVELARAGTRVAQLAETFDMTQASVCSWLKQNRIDRAEASGLSAEEQMELATAKRRMRQLETELAVSRKVNEVLLKQKKGLFPVISSLVGQGFDVQHACLMLGVSVSG